MIANLRNRSWHDTLMQCECRLLPLLPMPLNRTLTYTYPPAPFWTLLFLLASQLEFRVAVYASGSHTKYWVQDSTCLHVWRRQETQNTAHTAIRRAVPSPVPTTPSHDAWKPIRSLKISVQQKRHIFVLYKPCFWIFLSFRSIKVGKEGSERRSTFQFTSME